jgi:uncharacterized protein YigE (DUF2233 family)
VTRSSTASWLAAATVVLAIPAHARDGGMVASARQQEIAWEQLAPGVEHARARTHDESSLVKAGALFELYRFDLALFRPEVIVSKERPFARRRASDVLREVPGAVAVVNGGFFDEKGAPLGLRIAGGKTIVPFRRNVDWGVLTIGGGRARIVHSKEFVAAPGIEAAIQVGPRIVIDGTVPLLKPQTARRTAVALDESGKSLTLIVAPEAVDAGHLGVRLAGLGFHSALMLDGGPSTQLAVKLGEEHNIPGAYGVPDLLALVRRQ